MRRSRRGERDNELFDSGGRSLYSPLDAVVRLVFAPQDLEGSGDALAQNWLLKETLHEHCHHIQMCGTTYGLFRGLTDLIASQFVAAHLEQLPAQKVGAFLDHFDRARLSALDSFPKAREKLARGGFSEVAGVAVAASLSLRRALEGRRVAADELPTLLELAAGFRTPFGRRSLPDEAYRAPILDLSAAPLGTEYLLECGANLNDFLVTGLGIQIPDTERDSYFETPEFLDHAGRAAVRLFDRRADHAPYREAFARIFEPVEAALPADEPPPVRRCVTTCLALIDIALNPPLPPAYEGDWRRVPAAKLVPGVRYEALRHAAAREPLLGEEPTASEIGDYRRTVCAAAGVVAWSAEPPVGGWSRREWDPDETDTFALPVKYRLEHFGNQALLRHAMPTFALSPTSSVFDPAMEAEARTLGLSFPDFFSYAYAAPGDELFANELDDRHVGSLVAAFGCRRLLSRWLTEGSDAFGNLPEYARFQLTERFGDVEEAVPDVLHRFLGIG